MSDAPDKESKTEEATEKKVRDSVEKGQIPISREAPILASLAGLLLIFAFLTIENVRRLASTLRRFIDDPVGFSLDNGADAVGLLAAVSAETARFLVPIVTIMAMAGLASSFLQNAPRLAFERIQPQFSRLSVGSGWSRIFGLQGQVEFVKSAFKFLAISFVLFIILRAEEVTAVNAMFSDPVTLPETILTIAMRLVSAISVATIVLVALDLVWARASWRRDLKMTKQEVKDEHKQSEGDPLVKARLRSLARDRTRKRMMAAVPQASLVLANPTHYAIALKYVRGKDAAPTVLAKGKDLIALKIREIAEEHGIPVIEDKALVRSMYDGVEIDRIIPSEFFRAVAEIIYFLHTKQRRPVA